MPRNYDPKVVDTCVSAIRMLAVDQVEQAKSGHPGAPLGLADIVFEIWTRQLRYDPADPAWPNRDRFVLSPGHASALLYSMLHLSGYDVSLDDLRKFRQWGSKTPGHPEVHVTPGVEVTTGPLGQGIANAVGLAAGLKMLGARVNSEKFPLFTGRVFGVASDGDLQEGVSAEAGSLAGHLGLDNLVFFYDDNHITIDGSTEISFTEDVGKRYEAYGWYVQRIDGHDHAQIRDALDRAVAEPARPSLIIARTHIGLYSPKQDSPKSHGEPLGPDGVKATKLKLGWPLEPTFYVPDEVRKVFAERAEDGKRERAAWLALRAGFEKAEAEKATLLRTLLDRAVPGDLLEQLLAAAPMDKPTATRASGSVVLQKAAALVPSLVGGSADLVASNKTGIDGSPGIQKGNFGGRNIHYGIREHAMGSMVNGLAAGGGFIPYGSTFLIFSDYVRPAIRLAALSKFQAIYAFTHDSVYVGEDGPTHQPVEHLWALRLIPNVDVVRPADGAECAAAWTHALTRRDGPTVLALTRQNLPPLARPAGFDPKLMLRGAYVLADSAPATNGLSGPSVPTVVIVATGSEVWLAVEAKKQLELEGKARVRVVSAPCWEAFKRQDEAYRAAVLPPGSRRVVLEIGRTEPWQGVAGTGGLVLGWDDFGASAPEKDLQKHFGFTPELVTARIREWLKA